MKNSRITVVLLLCLIFALALFCPAQASSDGLIQHISITDGHGVLLSGFSFSPQTDYYKLYLESPRQLNFSLRLAQDAYLPGEQGRGDNRVFKQYYPQEDMQISFTAVLGQQRQTVTFDIYLLSDDNQEEDMPKLSEYPLPDNNNQQNNGEIIYPENKTDDANYADAGDYQDDYSEPIDDNSMNKGEDNSGFCDLHIVLQIGNLIALVNEQEYLLDAAPYLVSPGYTYVPLRFIAEAMGAQVGWDAQTRRVDIALAERNFSLYIGEIIPGTVVSPCIVNSRTFVPLRYVAETLGAQVNWNGSGQYVFIDKYWR